MSLEFTRMLEQFYRAGGIVSFPEWMECTAETRGMMIAARERVLHEEAALFGMAAQSPEGLARVLSYLDGGASEVRSAIQNSMDGIGKKK